MAPMHLRFQPQIWVQQHISLCNKDGPVWFLKLTYLFHRVHNFKTSYFFSWTEFWSLWHKWFLKRFHLCERTVGESRSPSSISSVHTFMWIAIHSVKCRLLTPLHSVIFVIRKRFLCGNSSIRNCHSRLVFQQAALPLCRLPMNHSWIHF